MNNEEKARELSKKFARQYHANNWPEWSDDEAFHYSNEEINNACIEMARWKDEQLGWHDAKKEQPPVDEEVIVLTNILNGKELGTPRMICFGHIVDKNICVDYDGWNIPGVAYWMYYNDPK